MYRCSRKFAGEIQVCYVIYAAPSGWSRRRVGERLGELRALLGEFRARRPKRVLGKLLRRLAVAERGLRVSQIVL